MRADPGTAAKRYTPGASAATLGKLCGIGPVTMKNEGRDHGRFVANRFHSHTPKCSGLLENKLHKTHRATFGGI